MPNPPIERRKSDSQMIERIAVLETQFSSMAATLNSMEGKLDTLAQLANKGRGGLAAILWVGGAATALTGTILAVVGFIMGHK